MTFFLRYKSKLRLCTSIIALAALGLAACSGGSSGTTPTPTPTSATTPTPVPTGVSFTLNGLTAKGLIQNGYVRVVDPASPSTDLVTGRTNATTGQYALTIPKTAVFKGSFVKVIVSGGPGALMVCDAAGGCGNGVVFGQTFAIDDTFSLSALIPAPAADSTKSVNVTALTDIVARLAEGNANASTGLSIEDINAATSQLSDLLGVIVQDFSEITPIDITTSTTGTVDGVALKISLLNAGIMAALVETGEELGTSLTKFAETIVRQNGQIVGNEVSDNLTLISLEDILDGAKAAVEATPIKSEELNIIGSGLDDDIISIGGLPAGDLTDARSSPNIGATNLEKAKSFVADIRLIQGAIESDASAVNFETFGDDVSSVLDEAGDEVQIIMENMNLIFEEIGNAVDANSADPGVHTYKSPLGFDIHVASSKECPTGSVTPVPLPTPTPTSSGSIVTQSKAAFVGSCSDEERSVGLLTSPISGYRFSISAAELDGAIFDLEGAFELPERVVDEATAPDGVVADFYDKIIEEGELLIDLSAEIVSDKVSMKVDSAKLSIKDWFESRFRHSLSESSDFFYREENELSFNELTLELDTNLIVTGAEKLSFSGIVSASLLDFQSTDLESYAYNGFSFLSNDEPDPSIQSFAKDYYDTIGNSSLALSGSFVLGGRSVDMSVSADFQPNGLEFVEGTPRGVWSNFTVENGILTDTWASGEYWQSFELVEFSDVVSKFAELGIEFPTSGGYERDIKNTDTTYTRNIGDIVDPSAPILKYSREYEINAIVYNLTAYFQPHLQVVGIPDSVRDNPSVHVVGYVNETILPQVRRSYQCYAGNLHLEEDKLFPEGVVEGTRDSFIVFENIDCENANPSDLWTQYSEAKREIVGSADATLSASIRQNIVGIDSSDSEVELAFASALSLDGNKADASATIELNFAGRRYVTNKMTFDLNAVDELSELVLSNQDGVVLTFKEDTSGIVTGTLVLDSELLATITEEAGGTLLVTYSDNSFESIL